FFSLCLILMLLLCKSPLFADSQSRTDLYDTVVVGAGIAGLSAASTLKKNGVEKILILEAADRIGGRVWTEDPWGSKLELGASMIHGIENSPTFEIVRDMNLTIQPTVCNAACIKSKMNSMALYDPNGKRITKEEVANLQYYVDKFEEYIDEVNA